MFKSVKETKMLLLSVKGKMLCLKANLIRAKALLPKAALLDWCAPGLRQSVCNINKDGRADGVRVFLNIWQKVINKRVSILKVQEMLYPCE